MPKAERIARSVAIGFLIVGIFISRQSLGIDISAIYSEITSYIRGGLPVSQPLLEGILEPVDELIGINDIFFQMEREIFPEASQPAPVSAPITEADIYRLRNFDYLRTQFYVTDSNTRLLPGDVDVDAFMTKDLTINRHVPGPRVLIFHTHSTEMFVDSDPRNPFDGVLGLGARLAEILEQQYGIQTIHDTTRYDIVDGRSQIMGAYERMEPYIRRILQDNPTIEVVIDLHRDGIPETMPPLVTYIDGKRTARIMFVNGLSRRYNSDGVLEPIPWLPNPNFRDNLAFSFQLQLAANRRYPGFTRRIFLGAFRYSLHLMPRTILLEVGAQNNTMEEAHNALPRIATVLAEVLLP